jgi:serine/threonine protein kinase
MNRDQRPSGSGPGVAAADPMIGQTIERYRLTDRLGEGGMGEVYAAKHLHIEKRVAIKLLRREILTNQEAVTRFRQEALSASSIGHKNIITIEDLGELPDGRIFLTMELLAGSPLSELIKGSQAPERMIQILIQTGHGLSAAHKKGIVHRDMKPENVFVTMTPEGEDVPKLLDFGIAKVSGADGNNHLTKTGTIFGTPFYMAPEQALGLPNVDHRADIYAMGVIMYEVFGGAVPFQGESFMGILTQHITAEPKPLPHMAAEHGKTLPPGVEEIIQRAMRKDPDHRYQSMDELVAALVAVYRGLVGPGMSGYLAAYPGSQGPTAPPPMHGGVGFPGRSGTISAPPPPGPRPGSVQTPLPYAHMPGAMPGGGPVGREGSVRYPVPSPDPQFTSGMHSAADSGAIARPRSRAGLIAILFVLMAAAGGGIALLVLSQKDSGKKPGTDVTLPDPGGDKGGTRTAGSDLGGGLGSGDIGKGGDTGDTGSKGGTEKGGTEKGGTEKGGTESGSGSGGPPDAGVDHSGGGLGIGGDDAGSDVAVAKVVVLVNSRPQGAEIIGPDGARLGRTPTNVWVEPGKPLEVTLKLRGRKELSASIDDRKKKVTLKLERLPRPSTGGGQTGGGETGGETGGTEPPDEPPDEPKDACDQDPGSIECRCLKSPELPECGLE